MTEFATTLAAAVDATQAKILVDDAAATDGDFYVQIDEEFLLVERGGDKVRRYPNTTTTRIEWQVRRGQLGSIPAAHLDEAPVTLVVPVVQSGATAPPETAGSPLEVTETYAGTGSHQTVAADLELGAAAGNVATNPKFLAAIMGNLLGADLTKEGAYLAGVIAALSITGARATQYQVGALLGVVMDGVTDADGAVVAVIDGGDPSSVTRANAAFAARINNNNAGSGVDYGLDLLGPANPNYSGTGIALAIAKAILRSPNEVCWLEGSGAPTDGGAGTGAGFAGPGSRYTRLSNGALYTNTGSKASPTWTASGTTPDLEAVLAEGNETGEHTIVMPGGILDGSYSSGIDLFANMDPGGASGGDLNVEAGQSDGTGGSTTAQGGDGGADGDGGYAKLTSGSGDEGNGGYGATVMATGGGAAGAGGSVASTAGAAVAGSGADGGDITLTPGAGDGAGRNGLTFLNLPTADPLVAGALWSDTGVVKVSAGA